MVLINPRNNVHLLPSQYLMSQYYDLTLRFPLKRKMFRDLWFANEIRSGILANFIKDILDIKTEETILDQDQSEI